MLTIDKDIHEYAGSGGASTHGVLTTCRVSGHFGSITLAFKESSLETPAGRIAAGPAAVIQILNDDPVPSVSFGTPALTIDEGMTQTAAILAEGRLASEVMKVGVRVTGDALISLPAGRPQTPGERRRFQYTVRSR